MIQQTREAVLNTCRPPYGVMLMRHFSLVRKPIKVVHLIWWKNSLVAKSVKTNSNNKPLVDKLNGAQAISYTLRDHPFKMSVFFKGEGSKIGHICWRIVVKNCWWEGGRVINCIKFVNVLNVFIAKVFLAIGLGKIHIIQICNCI